MSPDDDNGGWGARDTPPKDVLTVYNPIPGSWEYSNPASFDHTGCLFVRYLSPGQHLIYRTEDVVRMLAEPSYSETLKRRIAEGIARFTTDQKKQLAAHITPVGLATIRSYSTDNAAMIEALRSGGTYTALAGERTRPGPRL